MYILTFQGSRLWWVLRVLRSKKMKNNPNRCLLTSSVFVWQLSLNFPCTKKIKFRKVSRTPTTEIRLMRWMLTPNCNQWDAQQRLEEGFCKHSASCEICNYDLAERRTKARKDALRVSRALKRSLHFHWYIKPITFQTTFVVFIIQEA